MLNQRTHRVVDRPNHAVLHPFRGLHMIKKQTGSILGTWLFLPLDDNQEENKMENSIRTAIYTRKKTQTKQMNLTVTFKKNLFKKTKGELCCCWKASDCLVTGKTQNFVNFVF